MISRRNFLKTALTVTASYPFTRAIAAPKAERSLKLYNTHTDESLSRIYYSSGIYNDSAIKEINYLLRCHYSNEVMPINIKLLDLLWNIKDVFGKDREIHIVSGYRSHAYNRFLRNIGRMVAMESLHLYGLAIDFSIPGISSHELSRIAKSFSAGGVGRYPGFVHIDLGRIRSW